MKIKNLNSIIDNTISKEIKKVILEQVQQNNETYHVTLEGEPIETFETYKQAEQYVMDNKEKHGGKELLIDKKKYNSYEEMLDKLDEMGEQLEQKNTNMKKKIKESYEFSESESQGLDSEILDKMLNGYLEAAIFTEFDNIKEEMPELTFDNAHFDDTTKEDSKRDIEEFISKVGEENILSAISEDNVEPERIGQDLWLSRNGHGAGFFDGHYDSDRENVFMNTAKEMGEVNVILNDDMSLSIFGGDSFPSSDEYDNEDINEFDMNENENLDEYFKEKGMCSECGSMLNEEGMCAECAMEEGDMPEGDVYEEDMYEGDTPEGDVYEEDVYEEDMYEDEYRYVNLFSDDDKTEDMNEERGMCSECGSMLNEEGMCSECAMKEGDDFEINEDDLYSDSELYESRKRKLVIKESELISLIKKIIKESIPGKLAAEKSREDSKKDTNAYYAEVDKKLKNYLQFDGNDNPEFPHQIGKGDKVARQNTPEQDEEVAKNFAGLQNLDYDVEPSEKFKERLEMAIKGDSKMGNGVITEKPSIKPSNGADKGKEAKEKSGNQIKTDTPKKLEKQIKDRKGDKEKRVIYKKEKVPVDTAKKEDKNLNEGKVTKDVLGDIEKMKRLVNYNKKTQ